MEGDERKRTPGCCVERQEPASTPADPLVGALLRSGHQSRLCAAASSHYSCENQLLQWRWGGGAARRQEGGVRVELDWEDCITEGQQEPARGVGGAPSPFNRESLFLTASPLD